MINKWESGALFFKVQRSEAEVSVWAAFRYLVNHLFEMYGIEVKLVVIVPSSLIGN